MNPLTLDDFEWVEDGFDRHVLKHKIVDMSVASVSHYNGWRVSVRKESRNGEPVVSDALDVDAAKAIATLYANQHIEEYRRVFPKYSNCPRTPEYRPEAVPKGVFKVDRVRR